MNIHSAHNYINVLYLFCYISKKTFFSKLFLILFISLCVTYHTNTKKYIFESGKKPHFINVNTYITYLLGPSLFKSTETFWQFVGPNNKKVFVPYSKF